MVSCRASTTFSVSSEVDVDVSLGALQFDRELIERSTVVKINRIW